MNFLRFSLTTILVATLVSPALAQTTATTDPVGFVTVTAVGGAGGAKKSTLISLPLLDVDGTLTNGSSGIISSITSNSIVVTNANWTPGVLSQPSTPFVVQITTGPAAGSMFLVAANATTAGASGGASLGNTSSNLSISPLDLARYGNNFSNAGVAPGDGFKLFACDTLGSAFGVPGPTPGSSNSILGGTNAATSDNVVVTVNGTPTTYYYSTASSQWVRSPINSAAGNVALVPNYGVAFNRQSTNAFSFVITGQVPVTNRIVSIRNGGSTVLAQYWPAATTLNNLGLQNLPNWVKGVNQTSTDNVIVNTSGTPVTYYYFSSGATNQWRRFPLTASQDNVSIPVGAAVTVVKKANTNTFTNLVQAIPYNLNQ
jgi:hypothetical protein